MINTLNKLQRRLSRLRDVYVIPSDACHGTRAEIRSIVETVRFTSNIPDLSYEELASAADMHYECD